MDPEDQTKKQESIGAVDGHEKWVYDYSSLDYKGRIPLRASTGVWKASLFIIGIEFSEKLSYYSMGTSLIVYLTKVMHQDLQTAVTNANNWLGATTMITPLLGGFLGDAYLGQFYTILPSSIFYLLLGLSLLTVSQVVPSLKPCDDFSICRKPKKTHEIFFYIGMYLISISTGGYRAALQSFGANQFDDDHPDEMKQKRSFFNWWNFGLTSGLLLGVTIIVYIQVYISWAIADVILFAVMAFALFVFFMGRHSFRFRKPSGSPLTPLVKVVTAAIEKRNIPYPSSPDQLYESPKLSDKAPDRLLSHTNKYKFLDRAAISENSTDKRSSWRLATVTQVEEMKLVINMIPIWLTALPFGMCIVQASTFFIDQGTKLNCKLTDNFTISPTSVLALGAIGMTVLIASYDKFLVPLLRRVTGKDRGITILQRIGLGMVFEVITMVIAALVERKRLAIVHKNPVQGSVSMTVLWLAPQFLISGIGNGLTLVGLQEFFYDQVPHSMRGLGIAFCQSVLGASNFICNILIGMVDRATEKAGKSWFGKDLNSSRLDYFYWLLAGITAVNLFLYVFIARRYSYKSIRTET